MGNLWSANNDNINNSSSLVNIPHEYNNLLGAYLGL